MPIAHWKRRPVTLVARARAPRHEEHAAHRGADADEEGQVAHGQLLKLAVHDDARRHGTRGEQHVVHRDDLCVAKLRHGQVEVTQLGEDGQSEDDT